MEAVSFVLELHTGIVWKSCWVAYLFTTGLVAISFVLIGQDVFVGEDFERWRPVRA
ncbi:hypothetical protein BDU57DRAFT_514270 [Ampelomyces quisqualis]|uniref:Uncharacterized protein n=1 Tax=Ampelomyces quisqualis TaxID=50730 RepID=A0A6A5QQ00_AMPQU|nr:hypothetical protein BDU57DRAFT_514270 [Ampelomyces quisqualis]